MFGVGNEEWWGRLWKQTGGFADRRQNWQDDTVQSSTLAQRRRGNVAPGEQFWTRYASWLVASAVRHGWRPRFRWTLLCSEQGEQQNSARTEAGREDMNTNRKGGCCNDPLDWWRKREPACVGIPSRAIDAPCVGDAGGNSKLDKLSLLTWRSRVSSESRETPRLFTISVDDKIVLIACVSRLPRKWPVPSQMNWVLSAFNRRRFDDIQFLISLTTCTARLARPAASDTAQDPWNCVSSAYRWTPNPSDSTSFWMSAVNIPRWLSRDYGGDYPAITLKSLFRLVQLNYR